MIARRFDLVIPAYNRAHRLREVVESVFAAPLPDGWSRRVYLVDNNSSDDTSRAAHSLADAYRGELIPLFEKRQGSSHARNLGIATGEGELVGFIDDDETLNPDWFQKAISAFEADPALDFISGVYEPNYEAPPPDWLPIAKYPAVIGIIKPSDQVETYGPWEGEIMAGNLVIRRSVLDEVGVFDPSLGRFGGGTGTGEDRDLHFRLLDAGKLGQFRPELVIHHAIPESRMQRGYFIRWAWSNARSVARMETGRSTARSFLGVPVWRWGQAVRGGLDYVTGAARGVAAKDRFTGLLEIVSLAGWLRGRMGSPGK